MESMGKKPRRRRSFTPEFKAEVVELCQRGDRSVGQVARDFDLTETAVREWVRQAERDAGTRQDGGLTSAERRELAELRRENRRLREDVDILKRATAFFASRRPGELLPVHRGGESPAAQRQAGVRAAEGLPRRLLRRPGRADLGPGPGRCRADRADQSRAQAVEGPVRRAADPRGAAPPGPAAFPQAHRPADAPGRAGRAGATAVEEDHHPRPGGHGPGPMRSAGTSPPTPRRSTGGGAATSPTSRPGKAGSTWRPSRHRLPPRRRVRPG